MAKTIPTSQWTRVGDNTIAPLTNARVVEINGFPCWTNDETPEERALPTSHSTVWVEDHVELRPV